MTKDESKKCPIRFSESDDAETIAKKWELVKAWHKAFPKGEDPWEEWFGESSKQYLPSEFIFRRKNKAHDGT